jgi:hypothetical protein
MTKYIKSIVKERKSDHSTQRYITIVREDKKKITPDELDRIYQETYKAYEKLGKTYGDDFTIGIKGLNADQWVTLKTMDDDDYDVDEYARGKAQDPSDTKFTHFFQLQFIITVNK